MALNEIFINPALAASPQVGAGTIGDPYSSIEHAIASEAWVAMTRLNVMNGADDVLAQRLDQVLAANSWTPTFGNPLIIQGYTAAAADGGQGSLSGGGSIAIFDDNSLDGIICIDMKLHNTGAIYIVDLDDNCAFIRCEFTDCTAGGAISADAELYVDSCYIHNVAGVGCTSFGPYIRYTRFKTGPDNHFTTVISTAGADHGTIANNAISVQGSADGIVVSNKFFIENNSIYSDGGTGQGLVITGSNRDNYKVANNIIEGFSGAGGVGADFTEAGSLLYLFLNNSFYDNETEWIVPANVLLDGSNEVLTESAFTDAANGNFLPKDVGGVKEGSWPPVIGGGLV